MTVVQEEGNREVPEVGVAAKTPVAKRLTLAHLEVLLLAVALAVTVAMNWLTLSQTTAHFRIERTSGFVTRFNSMEMVALREDVDRWLESSESAQALYKRSAKVSTPAEGAASGADARVVISRLRTMANFFQEFGTAIAHGSLDERYACDLLGAICVRYGRSLRPFIEESRIQRKRPQAYEQVFELERRMVALDPTLEAAPSPTPGK